MKRIAALLLFIFLFGITMPAFANIESFLEELEEEETKTESTPKEKLPPKKPLPPPAKPDNPKDKPPPPHNKPLPPPVKHNPSYTGAGDALCLGLCADVLFDSTVELFAELLSELIVGTWLKANTNLTYGRFPYCPEGYIQPNITFDAEKGITETKKIGFKDYRGYAEISAFGIAFTKITEPEETDSGRNAALIKFKHVFDELSYGVDAEVHTYLLKCIGLDGEFWNVSDSSGFLSGGRAGFRISCVQTNYFVLGMYFHGLMWSSSKLMFGGALGFDCELYPTEPLVLMARFGVQTLENDIDILEADVSLGFIIDRFEIFAAYRFWLLLTDYSEDHPYHGGRVGVRTYF